MKKLVYVVLAFTISCSNSDTRESVLNVTDNPKPRSYYEKSSCDQTGYVKHKEVHVDHSNSRVFDPSTRKVASNERVISSIDEMRSMIKSSKCPDLTRDELIVLRESADRFDGSFINPLDYPKSEDGFQSYIDATGVIDKFSAEEMIRPHRPAHARACGYKNGLLPARCRWASGAVQGLLAGKLRAVINDGDPYGPKRITLRNWWRPQCYNKRVGGAEFSDHRQARGFDLDFSSPRDRATAQRYLCQLYKREKFSLQVGIGCQTLHIGMGSPKRMAKFGPDGSRFWTYGSLQKCGLKRLPDDDCWKVSGNGNKRIYTTNKSYSGGL
jgi:hypothetical protein